MEEVKISDKTGLIKRQQNELNFWFLVKHSIRQAEKGNDKQEAFLMNAAVMAAITLESLLSNLAEQYLPNDVYESFEESRDSAKDRPKKIIKYLTGQFDEFEKETGLPHTTKIKKIELDRHFFNKNHEGWAWHSIIDLINLRDEIAHYKTQDEIIEIINDKSTLIQEANALSISNAPKLIKNLENFFLDLKKILSGSVEDRLHQRFESFFDFLKIEL